VASAIGPDETAMEGVLSQAGSRAVLVVEDDQQIRQVIQWGLEDEGILVEVAVDGRQAVELALASRPAVVVLDWTLPGLMADAVADRLRAAYGDALPIVLITADGRSAEKAERIGARAYFHKPFDLPDLIAAVRRALAGA
jgi:DNA-binding response OmpR family regulator